MKRFLLILIAAMTLFTFVACANEENDNIDEGVLSVNDFSPNSKNVKFLGRTEYTSNTLWLAYSGSGAEFSFNGTKCVITFAGDDNVASQDLNNLARIAIFVNGERVVTDLISEAEKSFKVFESEEAEDVTVRIVKLSETGNSTCAIKNINVTAYGRISPTPEKAHSIEFIGDSITCGYGVDAPDQFSPFSTRTEDCTKAYAYLTAEILGVDYSLVSKSGHGIISGYTGDGTKQTWGIMPDYYESFGSGGGGYLGNRPDQIKWDFKKNSYDAVVINLGTNDASYTGNDQAKRDEYKEGYISFLKRLRKLNPDSKLICTLGIMGDDLYSTLESAVEEYKSKTKDENIITYRFTPQNGSDGYGADWHPSEATHKKAAEGFAAFVKDSMGW